MKKTMFALSMLLFIVTGGVLTSCKNFLSGEDFLTKLEEAIGYTNQEPFNIRFSANGGKISPSGDYSCRITDKITLIFTEDRDMCFLNWQVLLNGELLEPEAAANYITFEDANSPETKITINARVENLAVRANVAKRPTIVKASPQSDETGVYRDRTVVVQFSQDIDESTIYFTADELKELGVSTSKAFPVENGSKYYYAYWDGSDENSFVFKNIAITNYQYANVNYLRYFDVPKLDTANKKILRISTKIDTTTTPATSIAPPSATEILVTLNKNIAAKVENKSVGLSDDYGWTYFTNGSTDVTPPEFVDYTKNPQEGFIVTAADENQTSFVSKPYETTATFINAPLEDLDRLVKLNAKNKKLWIRGTFMDIGSGPARLEYKLSKVDSKYYSITDDEKKSQKYDTTKNELEISNGQFDDFAVIGQKASIRQNLDQSTGNDIGGSILEFPELKTEGTYRIDFTAYDKNNRPSSIKSFYFVYDTFTNWGDKIILSSIAKSKIVGKVTNSTAKNDVHWSHAKTEINGVELEANTEDFYTLNIDTGLNYSDVTITETDCFGNVSTFNVKVVLKPEPGMIYYSDGFWGFDYDSQRTVTGVICDVTDYGKATDFSKVRIWDLEEKTGLIWGSMDSPPYADHSDSTKDPHFNTKDGLKTYNIYKNSFSGGTFGNNYSYWYWLKNDKNKNSTITWYIPTYDEINKFIVGNYDVLKTAYDTLKTNGVSVTFINSVSETFKDSALTTCIPGKYENSNEKGYTRAIISYSNNKASIESNVTFRNGQSSTCHCMAQVDLTL